MTKNISLDSLNIDELLALRSKIDERLARAIPSEVQQLEKRLAELSKYSPTPPPVGPKSASRKKAAPGRRKSALKGTKAPVKFRDEKTGKAWSGRGMTPIWIREHETKGGKRDDFAV